MRDIEVAAKHYGLDFVKLDNVISEAILPIHTVIEAFKPVLGVWSVYRDEIIVLKLKGNDPSLCVMSGDIYSI